MPPEGWTPQIRRGSAEDAPLIARLAAEHAQYERSSAQPGATGLARALESRPPHLLVWLAQAGGDPLGYAAVTKDFSTWRAEPFLHLDCLFVREMHRKRGVGAQLFEAVQRYARARGIHTLEWQTPTWNGDAIRFYERMGGRCAIKARFSLSC